MASFFIRSSTIRLGIFISTLVIAVIVIFQLVWLKKIYRFEQKEFNHSVIKSIRGLYEDINASNYDYSHLNQLIENPEPHLYLAKIALPVNTDSLTSYLQYELEDFGVFTDCYLGIYHAASKKYIYSGLLRSAGNNSKSIHTIPMINRDRDHIVLYFPNRGKYIIAQMNFWITSSGILLLVLILFGSSLYYFYKQKFLNETQKDFIQNFTHEFKTPVSVISLAADVLKNPTIAGKPEKLATYAGIVEYQASYLKSQIEKLLNFAYTESGKLHFLKERVNLHELIHEAVHNLEPLIREKKATIHLDLKAERPFLEGNKDYLVIVIINLLDNAIKYSREPVITVSTSMDGSHLLLAVEDNGIGIEKADMRNLFRKFFRVRKEETYTSKGFGIGLAFVKKIVAAHHGRVFVSSEPGKGSTFTIEWPPSQ